MFYVEKFTAKQTLLMKWIRGTVKDASVSDYTQNGSALCSQRFARRITFR